MCVSWGHQRFNMVLNLIAFTFLDHCCEVRYDLQITTMFSSFLSTPPPTQLCVWRVMSFVCMFAYNVVWLYEFHGGCYLQAFKIPPYFGEVGVAHRINALDFLCVFIVFTLFVLYSMLPVFLLALPVSQAGSFAIMRKSKVILPRVYVTFVELSHTV